MKKTRRSFVTEAFVVLVAMTGLYPLTSHADGLQTQMDKLFGQMSNSSRGSAGMNARNGYVTGGSLVIRSPNAPPMAQIMNFSPPSFSAGCGGIDLNLGGFSMISGQAFVEELRAIASNAEGLAFSMAMSAMSNELSNKLSDFASKIQSRVNSLKSTCGVAQSALSALNITSAVSQFGTSFSQGVATQSGYKSDSSAVEASDTFSNPITKQIASTNPSAMNGTVFMNVVWTSMTKAKISSAYQDGTMLEQEFMSITGTIITCNPSTDSNCVASSGGGSVGMRFVQPTLRLEDLLRGQQESGSEYLKCDTTDRCMNPTEAPWTNLGFIDLVKKSLGTDGTTGIINALMTNDISDSTVQTFLNNSGQAGPELLRVGHANPMAMKGFALAISGPLALEMAYAQITSILDVVTTSLRGEANPTANQMIDDLQKSRVQIDMDYRRLRNQGYFMVDVHNLANVYLSTAPNQNPASMVGPMAN